MQPKELHDIVIDALDELKAVDVRVLDVTNVTVITDIMVIASGTSDRHVRSLARNVIDQAKKHGVRPMGVEGENGGEWILVDLHDVVVHILLPQVRDFYNLEKLWGLDVATELPAKSAIKH